MEHDTMKNIQDNSKDAVKTGTLTSSSREVNLKNVTGGHHDCTREVDPTQSASSVHVSDAGTKRGDDPTQSASSVNVDLIGDVNMEASITSEDIIRAGGFGARDDIGSLLPAAIDSTDFEASLRGARDYEESQEKINRPGLGWTDPTESKES